MARPQMTPERADFAKKCAISGMRDAEIVERLQKMGAKGLVEGTLRAFWLRIGGRPTEGVSAAPAAPQNAQPARPEPFPGPSEASDAQGMTPDEFGAWLGQQLRQAQLEVTRLRAANDEPGASRAMKLAVQLAGMLAKVHARTADDGDVVRVKVSDMQADAERARSKMHDLVSRLSAERAR